MNVFWSRGKEKKISSLWSNLKLLIMHLFGSLIFIEERDPLDSTFFIRIPKNEISSKKIKASIIQVKNSRKVLWIRMLETIRKGEERRGEKKRREEEERRREEKRKPY